MLCLCTDSVLNWCSHYYKDRHSKKNLASLPQEQFIPFKYIFFHLAHIGDSCDTPAQFQGEMYLLCRRKDILFIIKFPHNKIPKESVKIIIIQSAWEWPYGYRCIIKTCTILKLIQKKKKKISFMTKIHLQSFGFFNNKYLQFKDSA